MMRQSTENSQLNLPTVFQMRGGQVNIISTPEYESHTHKNTLIKGSMASASQQSVHSAQTILPNNNHHDIDLQNKGLKMLDQNFNRSASNLADKRAMHLRSLNLAQN